MVPTEAEPSARGDLRKTPFAHLVLYIQRQRLTGTLIVDRVGFESKVVFRNGRAIAARPLPRGTMLQDGLLELCDLEQAEYSFWNEDLLGEAGGVVKGSLDTLAFVADSVRGHVRDSVVAGVLERYQDTRLRLLPEADLKRLGLRGADARTVERLRETPMTPNEFSAQSGLSVEDARNMLYLLVIVGYIMVEPSEGAPAGIRSLSPASRLSNWPLGGGGASGPPDRRVSNASIPAPSHPPRHSGPPDSLRPSGAPASSQRPASRASIPAWQQLASMRPGPGRTPVPSQVVIPSTAPPPFETLDTAGKLRRAEQLAEHRNYDEATRIVDTLIAREPGNAECLAMRAWLHYQQFLGNEPPKILQDLIERSLRLDEQQPRALYLKGMVLKRMGRDQEAVRYFQKALDADPKHLEAQRELRLAKMRR